jgi:glyoxylase-like metal-dependent hydrolase (beta-lactamase superfamily II)
MAVDFRQRFIANIKRSVEPIARGASLYQPGREILPGLTALPAAGHTPGMAALLIHSVRTSCWSPRTQPTIRS